MPGKKKTKRLKEDIQTRLRLTMPGKKKTKRLKEDI